MTSTLEELMLLVEQLPKRKQEELALLAEKQTKLMKWIPNVGPQTEAYFTEAFITLFGGAGGGGKSDLGLGLSFTQHKRTLIMRRKYTDLSALTERAVAINGTRSGYNGSAPPKLQTDDGRLIEFGAAQRVGDEQSWQGRPHDLLYVDEAAQFAESQIRYLIGWVRSADENQRTRVVLGSNPPLSEEGVWMIKMFAPWLDPTHPNPAKAGELRYFVVNDDDDDIEVGGDGYYIITGKTAEPYEGDMELLRDGWTDDGKKCVKSLSRTFIPSKLADNPFQNNEQYRAQQDSLPAHLRSAIRDGNFNAARIDHELQLIPSDWILKAQERWTKNPPHGVPMCSIGCDIAAGGEDDTVLAPRYDGYYPELTVEKGRNTPYGADVAALIFKIKKGDPDIIIDMGGGYGNAAYEHLKNNGIIPRRHLGAEASTQRTKNGKLKFYNKRAEVYYRFYEALDPSQEGGSRIALPPDPILVSDLCSIRLDSDDVNIIKLEPKKKLVERLGRSPDRGDAVTIAWSSGIKQENIAGGFKAYRPLPKVVMRKPR